MSTLVSLMKMCALGYWILTCNQFLDICYGLQLRPSTSFIGFSRRGSPFENKIADSKYTFDGLLSGMPGVPRDAKGYPDGPDKTCLWSYKRSECIFLKKIINLYDFCQNRQFGYFYMYWWLWTKIFGKFLTRQIETTVEMSFKSHLGARVTQGIPGDTQCVSVNCNCQRLVNRHLRRKTPMNHKIRPHLEAVADIQKFVPYSGVVI